jgi:signal transduction histidine kinase
MRHRAQHIGGVIAVQSTKEKGTMIKLEIKSHDQVI